MRVYLSSVMVENQEKALSSYTKALGFVKKVDLPAGESRCLTVASPEAPNGVQLLLEPNANPAARTYQQALFEQGIPLATFAVDDLHKEYERMKLLDVVFRAEPTKMGMVAPAVFKDTCGNLIQLAQI